MKNTDGIKSNLISNDDRQLRNALNKNAKTLLKIHEELTYTQSESQLYSELEDSRKNLEKWFRGMTFNIDQIFLAEVNRKPSNIDVWRVCKRVVIRSIRA